MANAMNSPKMKSAPPLVQQIPPQQQQIPKKFFPLVGYILKQTWLVFKTTNPDDDFIRGIGLVITYLVAGHDQPGVFTQHPDRQFPRYSGQLYIRHDNLDGCFRFPIGWIGQLITNKGKTVIKPKQPGITEMFKNAGGLALAAILATAGLSLFYRYYC